MTSLPYLVYVNLKVHRPDKAMTSGQMQQKFAEFHDAKRIGSISLLSFSRKIDLHLKITSRSRITFNVEYSERKKSGKK